MLGVGVGGVYLFSLERLKVKSIYVTLQRRVKPLHMTTQKSIGKIHLCPVQNMRENLCPTISDAGTTDNIEQKSPTSDLLSGGGVGVRNIQVPLSTPFVQYKRPMTLPRGEQRHYRYCNSEVYAWARSLVLSSAAAWVLYCVSAPLRLPVCDSAKKGLGGDEQWSCGGTGFGDTAQFWFNSKSVMLSEVACVGNYWSSSSSSDDCWDSFSSFSCDTEVPKKN